MEIRTHKIYEMQTFGNSPVLFHDAEYIEGLRSEANLVWDFRPGDIAYELQYVFWDSRATDKPATSLPDYSARLFRKAVRIETWHNKYSLDASYPTGTLYCRVRAIGRFTGGPDEYEAKRYGAWSNIREIPIGDAGTLKAFEPQKNWQFSTTFAEEGKHKKVLTYYDGGLRGRQVITQLNDEETSLVAETDYSLEGQGVMSILPAPTSMGEDNFFFKEKFNQDAEGNAYGYDDFDRTLGATALSTVSGAGRYYSADNDFGGLYRDYVPDAGGFPLAQSRYLRDATGRMAAQGGVGDFHQLGQGRDTRYYYLNASATELHRLFGSNVGNSNHYKKNIVVDPNGQISLSYQDQTGKVIATALAGTAPTNVNTLEGIQFASTTKALNVRDAGTSNELMSRSSNYLFNAQDPTTYHFTYNLAGAFNETTIANNSYCTTCEYELTIYLKDESGGLVSLTDGSGGQTNEIKEVYSADEVTQACDGTTTYPTPDVIFSAVLTNVGTYEVIKELRVIGGMLDIENLQTTTNLTFPSLEDMLAQAITAIDLSDCAWSCESYCHQWISETCPDACFTSQGNPNSNYYLQMAECNPDRCLSDLELLGDNPLAEAAAAECEGKLAQMKAQVSPNGVYYNANDLAGYQALSFTVYDSEGVSFDITNGQISVNDPGYDPNRPLYLTDQNTGISHSVNDANDFYNQFLFAAPYWQEQWASTLVEEHQEYCLYQHCVDINTDEWNGVSSQAFDLKLARATGWEELGVTETWSVGNATNFVDAIINLDPVQSLNDAGNYQHPLGSCPPPPGSTTSPSYSEALANKLMKYIDDSNGQLISIIELVENYITDQSDPGMNGDPDEPYYNATPEELDLVRWQIFRGAYADVKERLLWTCLDDNACPLLPDTDPNAIFRIAPDLPENSTQGEIDSWFSNNAQPFCEDVCAGQADFWLLQIETYLFGQCNVSPISWAVDRQNAYDLLLSFCTGGCTQTEIGNSLIVEILAEDLSNDPDLIALSNILDNYDNACPGAPLDEVITEYTDYTFALPTACLQTIIQSTNDNILPEAGNSTAFVYVLLSTDPDYGCYQAIQSPTNGGHIIFVTQPDFDCPTKSHTIAFGDANGNPIALSDLDLLDIETLIYTGLPDDYPGSSTLNLEASHYSGFSMEVQFSPAAGGGTVQAYLFNYTLGDCFGTAISTFQQELTDCQEYLEAQVTAEVTAVWQAEVDQILSEYYNSQLSCSSELGEQFSVRYEDAEYHYTLYYHDQAGNLVQTVPPNGVQPLSDAAFDDYGNWDGISEPGHQINPSPDHRTVYRYNSLEQIVEKRTPDAGESILYYNEASQLRFSQNARQAGDEHWSYTKYDQRGRMIENGQLQYQSSASSTTPSESEINDPSFPTVNPANDYSLGHRIEMIYDIPTGNQSVFAQEYLRSRVSQTKRSGIETRYSYDAHGNVKSQENFITGLGRKRTDYEYDQISGNINEIAYQMGVKDAFYHHYEYDADNRLTHVHTSDDGLLWENDARYFYYLHGPLARCELGQDKVQGMDHYYTIHDWIKGVNIPNTAGTTGDPGSDGDAGINRYHAYDEMAYTLGYYKEDYQAINSSLNQAVLQSSTWDQFTDDALGVRANGGVAGLFNGNISWMISDLRQFNQSGVEGTQAMLYQYDQLHRITNAFSYEISNNTGSLTWSHNGNYDTQYRYDSNGNLLNLQRRGPLSTQWMDDLSYTYGANTGGPNRLSHVNENSSIAWSTYDNDVENQGADNYGYDEIGNLIRDNSEQISQINWTPEGKVSQVKFNALGHAAGKKNIEYRYDAQGNRLKKSLIEVTYIGGGGITTETVEEQFYSRGPDGTLLALYTYREQDETLRQEEVPIYGSKRLGLQRFTDRIMNVDGGSPALLEQRRGDKVFELNNHLGNTLATVSDQKHGVDVGPAGDADWYLATPQSGSDYYPFGLAMAGRRASADDYRYGFNGKENDRDWGTKWIQDYGFRLYNPSIAKFLSVDPLTAEYPWYTPYQFAGNMPIVAIDLDGLEPNLSTTSEENENGVYAVDEVSFDQTSSKSNATFTMGGFRFHGYQDDAGNEFFIASRYDERLDEVDGLGTTYQLAYVVKPEGLGYFIENIDDLFTKSEYQHCYNWAYGRMDNTEVGRFWKHYIFGRLTQNLFRVGGKVFKIPFRRSKLKFEGPGAAPAGFTNKYNWNWRSAPTFGHTFKTHGQGSKNTRSLLSRANSPNKSDEQGQWLNNEAAAKWIQQKFENNLLVPGFAKDFADIPAGLGQVIHKSGRIVPATGARIVVNSHGKISAFPILIK
ncbi:MAG: RHS repeat-associated core domain-containing protein [Bacteroidota bacterium]